MTASRHADASNDPTRAAVMARFVAAQRARRRRLHMLMVAVLVTAVGGGATGALVWARPSPSTTAAVRFVNDVTDRRRGHLRVAHAPGVDAVVYESHGDVSWIVAYANQARHDQLCLRGSGVAQRCFGTLSQGADSTSAMVWSGHADLSVYDSLALTSPDGSISHAWPLRLRTT
jgi:hypothetical protein